MLLKLHKGRNVEARPLAITLCYCRTHCMSYTLYVVHIVCPSLSYEVTAYLYIQVLRVGYETLVC